MKILIIISQYHPSQTPNTLRWHAIIECFQKVGHEVAVLTTKRNGYPAHSQEKEVTIYRAGYNTLKDRVYDFLKIRKRRNETNGALHKNNFLTTLLEKLMDLTWRKHYWPDGSQLFVAPGFRLGKKLLEDGGFTHMVSVGLPYSCHLIARKLKKAFPEVTWLMDIQDPFCYSNAFWVNNFKKYKIKNIEEERLAFESANAISLTNERALQKYLGLFDNIIHKSKVIPPLLDPPAEIGEAALLPEDKKYHIVYAGSFYTLVRSPEKFLIFLESLATRDPEFISELQFHFVGQTDRNSQAHFKKYPQLSALFTFHGFQKKAEAYAFMKGADFLLNFGNSTDYHLPSKVVDYAYLNKPIINIIQRDDDSSKRFFSSHRDILNLNAEDLETGHLKFKKFIKTLRNPNPLGLFDTHRFTKENIAREYLDLLLINVSDS